MSALEPPSRTTYLKISSAMMFTRSKEPTCFPDMLQAAVRRLSANLDDRAPGDLDEKLSLKKPRTTVDLNELPRAFTARQQELSTLTQRLVCGY